MSIFRPAALAALILAAAAPATLAAPAPAPAKHAAAHVDPVKKAACEKVWAAQKVRHGSHAAFVAACVSKG